MNLDILEKIKKTIAYLPKEEITHNMIFDLWFKDYANNWFKANAYNPELKEYQLHNICLNREDLLKMEYAMYPREV